MAAAVSRFYLASIDKPSSQIWFKKQPLGKNSLGSFMKSTSETAGLTGRYTNHSVRRTMISTLRKENVEPLNIIALAGQRNLKSLDSYSSTSTEQQKDMSVGGINLIVDIPAKAAKALMSHLFTNEEMREGSVEPKESKGKKALDQTKINLIKSKYCVNLLQKFAITHNTFKKTDIP